MRSRIFQGYVSHARLKPVGHAFRYPVWFCAIDLDEVDELDRMRPWFGINHRRPLSIWDRDYLDQREGTIREKLMAFLGERGQEVARIELVTSPRLFGYAFNPVSFYFCYRADGSVRCVLAEVNNTFGERHFYLVDEFSAPDARGEVTARARKDFHVSPFNDREGTYVFTFRRDSDRLDIRVDIERDGEIVFRSGMGGVASEVTRSGFGRMIAIYPLQAWLTVPRIFWQAAKLYFGKRLKFYTKPVPRSDLTMQTATPTLRQQLSMKLVLPFLTRITQGHIHLRMPDRTVRTFGNPATEPGVTVSVRDYEFFWRILKDGDIGFGESFTAGEWETNDLPGLLELFIRNQDVFDDRDMVTSHVGRFINRMLHTRRRNTTTGSRKNISDHYDLSNDFFSLFLDPTMMYSCALYRGDTETLEQAQKNKMHALIDKARISADDHVLEIGSGWGAFAIEAVRRTGCRVTTVTISKQQWELATRRVIDAGLQDRITILLQDYRHIEGRFDRIVSIEMLEAVGHEYLGEFFKVCDRVLKPKGLVVLQVITIPDQRYEAYLRGVDWIQKHIFPGGHLPSLKVLADAMTDHSRFVVENLENIGTHYARTLREWRKRFSSSLQDVRRLGFDDVFTRKWIYYLSYCEAAFASRHLNTLHLVLTRPNNDTLDESQNQGGGSPSHAALPPPARLIAEHQFVF